MFSPQGLHGWRRQARVGRAGPALLALLAVALAVAFVAARRSAVPEQPQIPPAPPAAAPAPAEPTLEELAGRRTAGAPAAPRPAPSAAGRLTRPVAGRVSTGFGWSYSPTLGEWRWHPGWDLAAVQGAPVQAAGPGTVRAVRSSREWGWEVEVDHGGGVITRYAGCRAVRVREGERVEGGQVIAEVGDGGQLEVGSGPHLHFEVLVDGVATDPARRLR